MYFPQIGETAEFRGFKYYEVATADSDYHGLVLFYKCKKRSFDCQILSGDYSLTGTKIIIDEQQNEVSWFETGFQRLFITDGGNFRGYTGLSAQFQGHQYQISDRCNKFSDKLGWAGFIPAIGIFIGLFEEAGFKPAALINAISYVLWSLWLIVVGIVFLLQ